MIPLTYASIVAKAQKAYDEGRLAILHEHNVGKDCKYRYSDGTCCVIGASFDDVDAKRFDKHRWGVCNLESDGEIQFPDFHEFFQTCKLQMSHDAVMYKRRRASRRKLAAEFFKKIDRPVPKHLQNKG